MTIYTELETQLRSTTTGEKAIDWLIGKASYRDDSTEGNTYVVGSFSGRIPYRMAEEVKKYGKTNGGCKHTGKGVFYLKQEINADGIAQVVDMRIDFGQYRSTANDIRFFISLDEFKPDDDEVGLFNQV